MYNDHSKGGICKNDDLFEKRFAKTGSQDTDIKGERRTAETNDLICEGIATKRMYSNTTAASRNKRPDL